MNGKRATDTEHTTTMKNNNFIAIAFLSLAYGIGFAIIAMALTVSAMVKSSYRAINVFQADRATGITRANLAPIFEELDSTNAQK